MSWEAPCGSASLSWSQRLSSPAATPIRRLISHRGRPPKSSPARLGRSWAGEPFRDQEAPQNDAVWWGAAKRGLSFAKVTLDSDEGRFGENQRCHTTDLLPGLPDMCPPHKAGFVFYGLKGFSKSDARRTARLNIAGLTGRKRRRKPAQHRR